MKPTTRRLLQTFVLFVCLCIGQGTMAQSSIPLATREVVQCLSPLEQPTLDNAVLAAKKLRELAATQQGPAKAATEKLVTEVRNLFYSEFVLTNAQTNLPKAEQKAQDKEKSAAVWLKPNAMGSVNRVAYNNEMEEAGRIRENAKTAKAMAKQDLQQTVENTKTALLAYKNGGQPEVANVLEQAARAVIARSLPGTELAVPVQYTGASEPKMEIDPAFVGPMLVGGLIVLAIFLRRLHPAPKDSW